MVRCLFFVNDRNVVVNYFLFFVAPVVNNNGLTVGLTVDVFSGGREWTKLERFVVVVVVVVVFLSLISILYN